MVSEIGEATLDKLRAFRAESPSVHHKMSYLIPLLVASATIAYFFAPKKVAPPPPNERVVIIGGSAWAANETRFSQLQFR